jgi:hypothetical protein
MESILGKKHHLFLPFFIILHVLNDSDERTAVETADNMSYKMKGIFFVMMII